VCRSMLVGGVLGGIWIYCNDPFLCSFKAFVLDVLKLLKCIVESYVLVEPKLCFSRFEAFKSSR
jgi:hypothetical protein